MRYAQTGCPVGLQVVALSAAMSAALLAVLPLSTTADQATKARSWQVGHPIVTYWAGPTMTDAAAQQLADGGWNLVWCNENELDVAQRHGLRAKLTDPLLNPATLDNPAKKAALDALIRRVRNHPALYGYFLTDEPGANNFPALAQLVAYLRERDPAHFAYVNLFPIYATNEQLGVRGDSVTAYQEYLRRFIETVKPDLLSYDHYQFAVKSDWPDYFQNLALVRRAALNAKIPFLNIVQACTWTPAMREPNEDEMRYLVYTTTAYGAQGISYYVYSHPGHSPGIATLDGKPTCVYEWLTRLNREFAALVAQLQPLRSTGVYHVGMMPPGAELLPLDSPFAVDPPVPTMEFKPGERVQGLLLGCFGKPGKGVGKDDNKAVRSSSHVLVVNLDYQQASRVTLTAPGRLERFLLYTGKWADVGGKRVKLELPPGGGILLRLRR